MRGMGVRRTMKTLAVISTNYDESRMFGDPEVVETFDITHYLYALETIRKLAKYIRDSGSCSEEMGKTLAYAIGEVERGLVKKDSRRA